MNYNNIYNFRKVCAACCWHFLVLSYFYLMWCFNNSPVEKISGNLCVQQLSSPAENYNQTKNSQANAWLYGTNWDVRNGKCCVCIVRGHNVWPFFRWSWTDANNVTTISFKFSLRSECVAFVWICHDFPDRMDRVRNFHFMPEYITPSRDGSHHIFEHIQQTDWLSFSLFSLGLFEWYGALAPISRVLSISSPCANLSPLHFRRGVREREREHNTIYLNYISIIDDISFWCHKLLC